MVTVLPIPLRVLLSADGTVAHLAGPDGRGPSGSHSIIKTAVCTVS